MRSTEATRIPGSSANANRGIVRIVSIVLRPVWMAMEFTLGAYELWRQRQALLRLDDHLLKDIGVSRADVEAEVHKPFWRE